MGLIRVFFIRHLITLTTMLGILCSPQVLSAQSSVTHTPSTHRKTVYLTFDDGPSLIYTPQILSVLKREHVHATFFLLGARAAEFPKIAQQIVVQGHEVGNHGFGHDYLNHKSPQWVMHDIQMADGAIHSATGIHPHYYRPPGGIMPTSEFHIVHRLGHPIVYWTVDSEDWKVNGPQQIVRNVCPNVRPGSIILFHDGISTSRYTVRALPLIIDQLKSKGYQFATLPTGE